MVAWQPAVGARTANFCNLEGLKEALSEKRPFVLIINEKRGIRYFLYPMSPQLMKLVDVVTFSVIILV